MPVSYSLSPNGLLSKAVLQGLSPALLELNNPVTGFVQMLLNSLHSWHTVCSPHCPADTSFAECLRHCFLADACSKLTEHGRAQLSTAVSNR